MRGRLNCDTMQSIKEACGFGETNWGCGVQKKEASGWQEKIVLRGCHQGALWELFLRTKRHSISFSFFLFNFLFFFLLFCF